MTSTVTIKNISELDNFATDFIKNLDTNVVLLNGEIGAGKTTFMRSVAKAFGGKDDDISSPTFSIINSFVINGKTIYHVDLYRIEDIYELEMTGFYDILNANDLIFIEWADKFDIKSSLKKYTDIKINVLNNDAREFLITVKK